MSIMSTKERMKDLGNWTEVTTGIYRYIIAAKVCYEIHIRKHVAETDIMWADANAYIAGQWSTKDCKNVFERECILRASVFSCICACIEDYAENTTEVNE
jgi:hypothetical protein